MVLAQGEVSNPEKTDRLKTLYTAVKQRNIPSVLVITKIETADKPLLNESGTIKEKVGSRKVERPRDMGNLYRSAKASCALERHQPVPRAARATSVTRAANSSAPRMLAASKLIESA